jgi:hypothetical protein
MATFIFVVRSLKQSTTFSGTPKRISGAVVTGQRVVDSKALRSSGIGEGNVKWG